MKYRKYTIVAFDSNDNPVAQDNYWAVDYDGAVSGMCKIWKKKGLEFSYARGTRS